MLSLSRLSVKYGDTCVINDVSFSVDDGQWLMIVGQNGAGKSTIVNAISQAVPYSGDIMYDNTNVKCMSNTMRAKSFGVLRQSNYASYAFTVEELVRLGRYAYRDTSFFAILGNDKKELADTAAVNNALEMTGLSKLRNRSILTLSGGELQRAYLAQLFAQDPKLLILDEPTNHLDLSYQISVLELIRDWQREQHKTVISVVHDLSIARLFGTHAVLLTNGRCQCIGEVSSVLTRDNLRTAYSDDVLEHIFLLANVWKTDN